MPPFRSDCNVFFRCNAALRGCLHANVNGPPRQIYKPKGVQVSGLGAII